MAKIASRCSLAGEVEIGIRRLRIVEIAPDCVTKRHISDPVASRAPHSPLRRVATFQRDKNTLPPWIFDQGPALRHQRMMKPDLSQKKAVKVRPTPAAPDRLEVQEKVLAMITFISNRLVAGVTSPIRDFAGLSVNEARIILLIEAGAVDTAADATRLIGIDQAAISRSVRRLIDAGFVASTVDKRDAKRFLLELTAKGDRYAQALAQFNDEREDRLLSVLSADERTFFIEVLGKVLANVESANAVLPRRSSLAEERADPDLPRPG